MGQCNISRFIRIYPEVPATLSPKFSQPIKFSINDLQGCVLHIQVLKHFSRPEEEWTEGRLVTLLSYMGNFQELLTQKVLIYRGPLIEEAQV